MHLASFWKGDFLEFLEMACCIEIAYTCVT